MSIDSYLGPARRRRLAGPDNLVNLPKVDGDWLSRQIIPDMYPRKDDPFQPAITAPQVNPPGAPTAPAGSSSVTDLFSNLTVPGSRPIVIQRGVSFQFNVTTTPTAITNQPFYQILLNNPSTSGSSVFFGFGNGITTTSGEEVRSGLPQVFSADNTREQWEVQRPLEVICNMMAYYFGLPGLASYRAPRIVWNCNDWYLVAGGSVTIAITLFYTPEMQ